MDLKRTPSNTVDALQTERTKKTCCYAYGAKLWLWCRDTFFPENFGEQRLFYFSVRIQRQVFILWIYKNQTNIMFGFLVFSIIFFSFYFLALIQWPTGSWRASLIFFFLFNPCRNEIFFSATRKVIPTFLIWSDQISPISNMLHSWQTVAADNVNSALIRWQMLSQGI